MSVFLLHVITISISHRGVYSLFSVLPDVRPLHLKSTDSTNKSTLSSSGQRNYELYHEGTESHLAWVMLVFLAFHLVFWPHSNPSALGAPVCDCMKDGALRSSVLVTGGFLVWVNYCHIAPCVCTLIWMYSKSFPTTLAVNGDVRFKRELFTARAETVQDKLRIHL